MTVQSELFEMANRYRDGPLDFKARDPEPPDMATFGLGP